MVVVETMIQNQAESHQCDKNPIRVFGIII